MPWTSYGQPIRGPGAVVTIDPPIGQATAGTPVLAAGTSVSAAP